MNLILIVKKYPLDALILLLSFLFSYFLMSRTFSYENGNMLIAAKAWSDFGSHIPLIRSFSLGWNFPVAYPLFSGEPIHYHFLFYLFVGLLEKIGLPINYALNIPAAVGFTALVYFLYLFASKFFKSKATGILTIFFFLFNGSFSFIYFLNLHPLSEKFIEEIVKNSTFPSFAPYREGLIAAFWNLNIYTNQRHLAMAFAFSLFIIYFFIKPVFNNERGQRISGVIFLGILLGCSYYFHIAVFLMTVIVIIILSILFSKVRAAGIILLICAAIISYPQCHYMNSVAQAFQTTFRPGYLIYDQLSLNSFFRYWFMNLGLHSIIMFLGFILAKGNMKKIFLAFFALFIIGNLFQFSPEMAANHKFFNYFMLVGIMFSAYFLVFIWRSNLFLRPLVVILFFFLTFSGIIDLFPVLNDQKIRLTDYPNSPDIKWIIKNTDPNSTFLNTSYLYAPESLAGRKIFFGWPYFAWSAGHDTDKRGKVRATIFTTNSKSEACSLLKKNNLSYIEISNSELTNPDQPKISNLFNKSFTLEYKSNRIEIYNVRKSCKNI